MKTLTTFLMAVLFCSLAMVDTQTFAQDAGDDSANVESDQLEATVLQLREQLMKLERERGAESVPTTITGSVIAETPSLSLIRSGKGIFDNSQVIGAVQSQLPTASYSVTPYQQAIPMPATLPSTSTWLGQPMPHQFVPTQSVPTVIASPAPPVYAAPAIEYSQPAPIVEQPAFVQQAPAPQVPQTIIVNIYQQAPPAQNNFFPSIMAPIYGPPPIQVSAPRRGCCLFGRR